MRARKEELGPLDGDGWRLLPARFDVAREGLTMKHMKVVSKDAPSVASIWSWPTEVKASGAKNTYAALLATFVPSGNYDPTDF